MNARHMVLLAAALAASAPPIAAQSPPREIVIRTRLYTPPSAVIHAEANLVETAVIVRDGNGRAVGGLRASDFEVRDNSAPQKITAFSEIRSDAGTPVAVPALIAKRDSPAAQELMERHILSAMEEILRHGLG